MFNCQFLLQADSTLVHSPNLQVSTVARIVESATSIAVDYGHTESVGKIHNSSAMYATSNSRAKTACLNTLVCSITSHQATILMV